MGHNSRGGGYGGGPRGGPSPRGPSPRGPSPWGPGPPPQSPRHMPSPAYDNSNYYDRRLGGNPNFRGSSQGPGPPGPRYSHGDPPLGPQHSNSRNEGFGREGDRGNFRNDRDFRDNEFRDRDFRGRRTGTPVMDEHPGPPSGSKHQDSQHSPGRKS